MCIHFAKKTLKEFMYSKPVPFLVNEYDFRICHIKECRLPQWFFKPHKISWCAQHPILVFSSFIYSFSTQYFFRVVPRIFMGAHLIFFFTFIGIPPNFFQAATLKKIILDDTVKKSQLGI